MPMAMTVLCKRSVHAKAAAFWATSGCFSSWKKDDRRKKNERRGKKRKEEKKIRTDNVAGDLARVGQGLKVEGTAHLGHGQGHLLQPLYKPSCCPLCLLTVPVWLTCNSVRALMYESK